MLRNLRRSVWLALGIGVTSSSVSLADERTPPCLQHWPEVRYRNYGHDHIVHIANACRTHATCSVWSDVTPTPVEVEVPAAGQLEVLICRGCAARDFTPQLSCRFIS